MTVTAQSCPLTCQLAWSFDPTAKDVAWPDGSVSARAAVQDGGSPEEFTGWSAAATFVSPLADFTFAGPYERTETANTTDYGPSVMDTHGVVRVSSPTTRKPGETLVASLRTPVSGCSPRSRSREPHRPA